MVKKVVGARTLSRKKSLHEFKNRESVFRKKLALSHQNLSDTNGDPVTSSKPDIAKEYLTTTEYKVEFNVAQFAESLVLEVVSMTEEEPETLPQHISLTANLPKASPALQHHLCGLRLWGTLGTLQVKTVLRKFSGKARHNPNRKRRETHETLLVRARRCAPARARWTG